jgi:hypothetical protein
LLDWHIHMSQWILPWTTNTILRIKTAVRRFLTRIIGAFAAGCWSRRRYRGCIRERMIDELILSGCARPASV